MSQPTPGGQKHVASVHVEVSTDFDQLGYERHPRKASHAQHLAGPPTPTRATPTPQTNATQVHVAEPVRTVARARSSLAVGPRTVATAMLGKGKLGPPVTGIPPLLNPAPVPVVADPPEDVAASPSPEAPAPVGVPEGQAIATTVVGETTPPATNGQGSGSTAAGEPATDVPALVASTAPVVPATGLVSVAQAPAPITVAPAPVPAPEPEPAAPTEPDVVALPEPVTEEPEADPATSEPGEGDDEVDDADVGLTDAEIAALVAQLLAESGFEP